MTPETIYVLGQLQWTDDEKAALVACKLKNCFCYLSRYIYADQKRLREIAYMLHIRDSFVLDDGPSTFYVKDFPAISEYIISHKIEFKPYVFPKSTLL